MAAMGRRALTGLLGLAGVAGVTEAAKHGLELAKEEAGVRACPQQPDHESEEAAWDPTGINITHYGYKSDPFIDPESAAGIGKYTQHLVPYTGQGVSSVALMDALARRWGLKPGQQFTYGGHTFHYDDTVVA